MSEKNQQPIRDERNIIWKLKIGGEPLTIARYLSIDHFSYLVMDREGNILALAMAVENLRAETDGTQFYAYQAERAVWYIIPMDELHMHMPPARELELSDYVNGVYSYKNRAGDGVKLYSLVDAYPIAMGSQEPENPGDALPGIFD